MAYSKVALILGDCLFKDHAPLHPDQHTLFFMAEDFGLCTHFKYHKHKLTLFLSAMRHHAANLEKSHTVIYHKIHAQNKELSFEDKLDKLLETYKGINTLTTYHINDIFFRERISNWCKKHKITLQTTPSQGFTCSSNQFESYLQKHKRPFMQTFYKEQRQKLNLLLTEDGQPLKGAWSFDKENRKPLPKSIKIPDQPQVGLDKTDHEVIQLVDQLFKDHPGKTDNFNWSTTRRSALHALDRFLKERFEHFGPYEDAIAKDQGFLFHTALSPYINMGLLTPDEVLDKVVSYYKKNNTHFPSVEGLVRQIAGWREFMRGIYNHFDLEKNNFNHQRKMKKCWYEGTTGILPLDDSIKKANRFGYSHHIERLMILGNLMLLTGLHPKEVYKWFMEMYVDSADWVMAPNVYGMSQFAEGGIFATKPYICGSNYLLKMSDYKKGPWCDIVDGLYWRFIDKKRITFENNPRMALMVKSLDRMADEKKKYLFHIAEKWIDKVSYT